MSLYNGITITLSLALQESLRCAWDDHQQLDDTNRVSQYWVKWNTPTGCQLWNKNGMHQLGGIINWTAPTGCRMDGWIDWIHQPGVGKQYCMNGNTPNRVLYSIGRHQSGVTIFNGQQSGGIINGSIDNGMEQFDETPTGVQCDGEYRRIGIRIAQVTNKDMR